ncbi:hypothetical protein [Photobacterium leiognathi]|uniref:hypothetical protein n=1 Tax=Photobacterium leiognathi TaxID=553611 RepID=UPI0011B23D6A|nr:hypothetical protein [Photobacterium leiognathi]
MEEYTFTLDNKGRYICSECNLYINRVCYQKFNDLYYPIVTCGMCGNQAQLTKPYRRSELPESIRIAKV